MTSYYPPQFSYTKFNPLNFDTDVDIEKRLNTVQSENNTIKTNIDTLETKTSKLSISGSNTVISSDLVPNTDGSHRLGLSENNTFNLYGHKVLINNGTTDTSIITDNIGTHTSVNAINQSIFFNTSLRDMFIGQAYEDGNNSNNGFTVAISGGVGANPDLCNLIQKDGTIYLRGELRPNDIRPNIDNTYSLGNATYRFDDVYCVNTTINTSDERHKKDIETLDLEKTINFIKSLRPVSYKWKNKKRLHCGLIYQDLEPLTNELLENWGILHNENDTLGVRYDELLSVLVKTYQYLIKKNEELENRLKNLSK